MNRTTLQVRLRLTDYQPHAPGSEARDITLQSPQWLLVLVNVDRVVAEAITAASGDDNQRKVLFTLDPVGRRCTFRLGDADMPLQFTATERTGLRDFDEADHDTQVLLAQRVADFLAGRRTVSNQPGKEEQPALQLPDQLAFTPADLHRLLPIGRGAAYALARQVGKRVGPRKLVIARDVLLAYLAQQPTLATGRLPGQPVPKLAPRRTPTPARGDQGSLL